MKNSFDWKILNMLFKTIPRVYKIELTTLLVKDGAWITNLESNPIYIPWLHWYLIVSMKVPCLSKFQLLGFHNNCQWECASGEFWRETIWKRELNLCCYCSVFRHYYYIILFYVPNVQQKLLSVTTTTAKNKTRF